MSKCVNPFLFRLILNRNWNTFWYSDKKNFAKNLIEDIKLKLLIKKFFKDFIITKIFISKSNLNYIAIIYIKKKNLNKFYKYKYQIILNKISSILNKKISLNIKFEKNFIWNPVFIFNKISEKIKKKKSYKNIIKSMLNESIKNLSFGFKIQIKGRINGSTMAKTQIYKFGKLSLSTFSSNIKYYSNFCKTNFGIIGIKIWIYLGKFLYK